MIHRVILQPQVRQDDLEIEEHLQASGGDVVRRFRQVLANALRRLRERPTSSPEVWRDVRRAQTRPFRYGVFFVVADEVCIVIAIVDLRRHPRAWQQRR